VSRKVDITEVKREHKRYDPIPARYGFGVTIQILETYKPGRFSDLQQAVERRNRLFYLGDPDATKSIDEEVQTRK
jgi:hypothetical protein